MAILSSQVSSESSAPAAARESRSRTASQAAPSGGASTTFRPAAVRIERAQVGRRVVAVGRGGLGRDVPPDGGRFPQRARPGFAPARRSSARRRVPAERAAPGQWPPRARPGCGARSATPACPMPGCRGVTVAGGDAQHPADGLARHRAGPQQHGLAARQVHDRGLQPDLAIAAVEDDEARPEFVPHVLRARGAHVTEPVALWSGDGADADLRELAQGLLRHGMRGAPRSPPCPAHPSRSRALARDFPQIIVSGPGQKSAASLRAASGMSTASRRATPRARCGR